MLSFSVLVSIERAWREMIMEIVLPLLIGVVIVTAAFAAKRFSGYINRIIGIFLFSVLAYITVVAIVAVAFRGARSLDEIIAMLL